jgi:DNA-binding transcriptional LysR family regulator
MTLHQLRIFESVARHLNITRASQELHMSQPAVSQKLKLLEEQCETRFVVRTNQGVELTETRTSFSRCNQAYRSASRRRRKHL